MYFTRRGIEVVILLCGGDKRTQAADGNPSFDTILKVTKALGLRVTISKAA